MQPPQSIEEIKEGLETTEKGGVRQSIRNCLTVFQRDPLLSGAIAYNILTDRKDIIKPIGFHRESTALNDTDMKYLLLYLEETYGLTNEKKIDNAIGIVANENKYHPIRDYLSALVWDGTERIRFCLRHFLGADADDYTYEALKLFLLGAISRAFQPGCKFEIMLCLVGGQGAGKSTFFRLLAVRDEWFSDDLRKLDRLLRRSCLLVASSFTISSRNSTSDSYNTFVFVVADIPICLLPASTPNDTGCTFLSDSYCSCMVNGHFFTTFAIPDFNIRQTFPCRSVGINGCPSFATTYTMIQVPFFWCVTAVSRTHLP